MRMSGILGALKEGLSQGLKPHFCLSLNTRAKARAYLRSNSKDMLVNGTSAREAVEVFAAVDGSEDEQ